ncbi:HTH-type transcriptional regulator immR, partial [Dysosmobacter welbionis]
VHGLHQGLIVVLGEAVAPLGGLHGQLDIVGGGIIAVHQAQGLHLAAVVGKVACHDLAQHVLDGLGQTLHGG